MRTIYLSFLLCLFSTLLMGHVGDNVRVRKPPDTDPEKVEINILPLDQGRAIMMLLEYVDEVQLEMKIFDEAGNEIFLSRYSLDGEKVIFEDLSNLRSGKYLLRFTLGEEMDEHTLFIS